MANAANRVILRLTMRLRRTIATAFILGMATSMLAILAARLGLIDLPRRFDPFAVPNLAQPPNWLTSTQLKLVDLEPLNCKAAFSVAGIPVLLKPTRNADMPCEIEYPIEMTRLSQARLRPTEMRCNIGARLYMWEKHVLQPAALYHFKEPIADILHFGSFSCRTIAGSSNMSEHANANAFDIAGFRLRSGRQITLLKDWSGAGPEASFLRTARDGLCDYFNVTLSPDYNAAHRDHFHVDMGWWRSCR
jgi:hypothetical protein